MDFDFSTLLYIIFAIIYFVFSSGKKKQKKQQRPQASPANEQTPRPRRESRKPTFEELLEEFTGAKTIEAPKPEPVVIPEPVPVYKAPEPTVEQKSITTAYDKLKHRSMDSDFERFERFETEEEGLELDDLCDANTARKAFIYSEIFNRKY